MEGTKAVHHDHRHLYDHDHDEYHDDQDDNNWNCTKSEQREPRRHSSTSYIATADAV